jgi:pimeloyl-ACP methyl ester carboxylesterase
MLASVHADEPVPDELDPGRFETGRATVRDGLELAYARAGAGGRPLLLVHGWPETRRIWWRNLAPLAEAGFEVIAPDLRGFGDSGLAPDGHYDVAAHARDLHALVHDVLGHERCVAAGGDLGGLAIQDLALRFEGFVTRQCLFNTIPPFLPDAYREAGLPDQPTTVVRQATDYFRRQGKDADALAAELDTPERRRAYIAQFYGPRWWAAPGTFTRAAVDFMTEPYADGERMRASFGNYESATGTRELSEAPRIFERSAIPTLVLYGPEDHVIPREFPRMCEVGFEDLIGPFVVEGAGHFLQWERADVLNGALRGFLGAG